MLARSSLPDPLGQSTNNNRLIAVDTIMVDEQSRLTLTKRVKQVLPIEVGDKIAIYEDSANPNNLIWKIQRSNEIISSLTITKNVIIRGGEHSVLTTDGIDRPSSPVKPANIMLIDDEQDVLLTFNAALSYYSKEYNIESLQMLRTH
jgi:hypothetical protein